MKQLNNFPKHQTKFIYITKWLSQEEIKITILQFHLIIYINLPPKFFVESLDITKV